MSTQSKVSTHELLHSTPLIARAVRTLSYSNGGTRIRTLDKTTMELDMVVIMYIHVISVTWTLSETTGLPFSSSITSVMVQR